MTDSYAGSINPGDVATLSLLGRGGMGGYGYGGGYGGGREFANDSSNAVRIRGSEKLSEQAHAFTRDSTANSHDSLSQQISDNADRNRDISRVQIEDGHYTGILDKISDQSRFFTSEINLITREQAANARAAAECCCEAKLLAATNQAKTDAGLATILANQECASKVADAVANANQNAKLDALLNERGGHHSGN